VGGIQAVPLAGSATPEHGSQQRILSPFSQVRFCRVPLSVALQSVSPSLGALGG
jgi:hypothetical protein